MSSVFANISLLQLALVAAMALIASLIGGIAGYGTGALMPLVLVPIVGAEPVVPIIALSALLTNSSRAIAYRQKIDPRRALIVLAAGIRLRETLLPLLLLPVLAPVMLGATRAFEDGLEGAPGDAWPWVALLGIFAVLYTAVGVLAFGPLWEES